MGNKCYKFSIIIPIYKVEDYLEETILSVINQSIGFEENIQMILVNDGSPDNSHLICEKYRLLYPNNIIYIEQKNAGVSVARNNGMTFIKGEYVNFLDSDDKWPLDAFEKVYDFFEENKHCIDVVACILEYFEAKQGFSHPLNFKFTSDKIIDIESNANLIQMHMASCFIKKEALTTYFNKNLKYGEDSLFINEIILNKKKYGIMKSVSYMYRKRTSETSAIDTCQLNPEFYEKTLTNFHDNLIDLSIKKFGKVIPYVQYLLMYDLQWRIKRKIPENILNEDDIFIYQEHICNILKNIEDNVIVSQRNIWSEHKIFALSLKYNKDITRELEQNKHEFNFNRQKLFSVKNKSLIKISTIKTNNNVLHLEGIINTPIKNDIYQVYLLDQNNNKYILEDIQDYVKQEKVTVYGHYYYNKYFKIDIPLQEKQILKLKFYFQYKNNNAVLVNIGFLDICNLNTTSKMGYLKLKNNIVEYRDCKLIIRNNSKKLHIKKEVSFSKNLWKLGQRKLVLYRLIRLFLYYLLKKEIWLVSDRPNKAGDNGEAFFKYLQSIKNNNIKSYFVLDKTSEDYKKMKKIGKVVDSNSIKYKLLFLLSSKIISSQASDYVINPFKQNKKYMKDLYNFNFIFLQHGITKDDLSSWLNKLSKPIDIFVTAGIPEYNSLLNGNYYYGEDVVKLTGFPRHDTLFSEINTKKQIAIIPTWRKSIDGCVDIKNDTSIYNKNFKDSTFFKFYNNLINNEKLLKIMKQYGYTGIFCLHPLFQQQYVDFDENDIIEVNHNYLDYQKIFKESSLLITDYSSVFFDFAYLNKPIIYSQFDKEEFFNSHSYDKGYFDYEIDGFGEINYDLDSTIESIIKQIQNNCILEKKYKENIDKFYPQKRGSNSENVYNAILRL